MMNFKKISDFAEEGEILLSRDRDLGRESLLEKRDFQDQGIVGTDAQR